MGGSSRRYRAADRTYTDRGPIIWWAKRLKPGDVIARWSFYGMDWETVTVFENRPAEQTVYLQGPGFDFESYYRLRPKWWPKWINFLHLSFIAAMVLGFVALMIWNERASKKELQECKAVCAPLKPALVKHEGCMCIPKGE